MYCIISENREEVNTTKGVTISIEFKEYKNVLFNKKLIRHKMKRIQSKLHKIGTCNVSKISFYHVFSSKVIEGIRTVLLLFFSQILKRKKHKANF